MQGTPPRLSRGMDEPTPLQHRRGQHPCKGAPMIINPGSDRKQGPWDPDAKEKWIDTQHFWVQMPLLLLMVGIMVLVSFFGS